MIVYVGLGSSVGDRLAHIDGAIRSLTAGAAGFFLRATSPVYATRPAGGAARNEFYNGVAQLEGSGRLDELLAQLHRIEARAGRVRSARWADRELDLDIVCAFDGKLEIERAHAPVLPHPRMLERDFVLAPLLDLDPILRSLGRPLMEQLDALPKSKRTIVRCIEREGPS